MLARTMFGRFDVYIGYGMVLLIWYGMVWYGMVGCGMIWYGMVGYGMIWHGLVRKV